jgi:hypothetical protein
MAITIERQIAVITQTVLLIPIGHSNAGSYLSFENEESAKDARTLNQINLGKYSLFFL